MTGELPPTEKHDPYELYPNPEDWEALQGGKPRVFRNPKRPNSRWIVMHVYDEHPSAEKRFKSGAIVETLPPDPLNIPTSRLLIRRFNENGDLVERDIVIPSFMHQGVHGVPCENRSTTSGGERYDRITNQRLYEGYLRELAEDGMEELRYGVQDGVVKLIPMLKIRDPRPLG